LVQYFEENCSGCSEKPNYAAVPEGFARASTTCDEAETARLSGVAGAGIGIVAATAMGRSVSTCITGAGVMGSTTSGVGSFDRARGGGCCKASLELC